MFDFSVYHSQDDSNFIEKQLLNTINQQADKNGDSSENYTNKRI